MGIPTGGAADQYSQRLVNAVVGNDAAAATLEMMLMGGTFEVRESCVIAVAGADMQFQINGTDAEMGRATAVGDSDILSFGYAKRGCFTYLAVAGGFDGAVVLGSRSTYVAGRLGGHFGRSLRPGDELESLPGESTGGVVAGTELLGWPLEHEFLRFVRGPQAEYFTPAAYETFTKEQHTVSPRSNRMAHRLVGPRLEIELLPRTGDTGTGPTDIVEDGNAVGAIQVAGGVEPICMGRDCPTSGAYAKIGCIITPDVDRLAQMRPGDSFRFLEVSVSEANEVSRQRALHVRSFGSA